MAVSEEVERLALFSPAPGPCRELSTAASLGLSKHTLKCEDSIDRRGIYNSGSGVSKGSKNRTWMTSATDQIAPATPSVIAGGRVKGAKGGRESRGASPRRPGSGEECGSRVNTGKGSDTPWWDSLS